MSEQPSLIAIRDELERKPDAALEDVAARLGATMLAVLSALPPGQVRVQPGSELPALWRKLAAWGDVTLVVPTGIGNLRFTAPVGVAHQGRLLLHLGEGPIAGALRADRCAGIFLVERPELGSQARTIYVLNREGRVAFKVLVGEDQIERFEALRGRTL